MNIGVVHISTEIIFLVLNRAKFAGNKVVEVCVDQSIESRFNALRRLWFGGVSVASSAQAVRAKAREQ